MRTVDTAQYQNRLDDFDFDMVVASWGQSQSPGNEQRDFWGTAAAETPGSRNLAGIKDPVVDALVDEVIRAPDPRRVWWPRPGRSTACCCGATTSSPTGTSRLTAIAYWNKFSATRRSSPGYGLDLFAWWVDPVKVAALQRAASRSGEARAATGD